MSPPWHLATTAGVVLFAVVVALLAVFLQVVREAVRQGDLRREATARHSAAIWRCTAFRSIRQRDICLAQLNPRPPEVTLLRTAGGPAEPERHAQTTLP